MTIRDDVRKSLFCIEHSKTEMVHGVKILKKGRGGLNGYPGAVAQNVVVEPCTVCDSVPSQNNDVSGTPL